MTSRELLSAVIACGLPIEVARPKWHALIRCGLLSREGAVDPQQATLTLLCAMSFRPATEIEGICMALESDANLDAVCRVEMLSRGLHDVFASVYLVDDWRTIETVHVDIVPPVTRGGVQMRRVRGAHVAEIGRRGGWWGACPPPDTDPVLPGVAPDRRPRS